jgi:biopolymer transport protein ExbD
VNLRPYRRRPPEINLTPLLDVVFLLLIFFMVSTTFKDEARLRVQLPQAQGEDVPAQEPEQIRILIDRAGNFFVNDRAVVDRNPLTLARALNGALGDRPPGDQALPVLILADANTPHQAVMTAMDAAAELGLRRIAFGASRGGGEGVDQRGGTGGTGQAR